MEKNEQTDTTEFITCLTNQPILFVMCWFSLLCSVLDQGDFSNRDITQVMYQSV